MSYKDDRIRTINLLGIVCILLLFSENVVAQLSASRGVGVPLPILNESPLQGQSAVRSSAIVNPPFTVKHDSDDSIVSPNFGLGVQRTSATQPEVIVNNKKPNNIPRGPGSLQHIQDPMRDNTVRSLLNHPVVLKKIQKETSSDSAVKVDSVITAHKQVVSGEVTYLDLKIVETKCPIGTLEVTSCETDTTEDPHICEIAVWSRNWLNSTKIVDEKTKCAEIESDTDFVNWNKGNPVIRSQTDRITLRELPSFLDEKQVALEAFDYVNRGSDSKFKGQMVQYHLGSVQHDPLTNITTVDVKVEYGFTLCLKFPKRKVDDRICPLDADRDNYVCTVTVMADPNLTTNLKVIPGDDDEIDCEKKESVGEELVVPVRAVCMGCPQTVSLNDPSVLKAADFAVIEYDRTSDERELHSMIRLHKAHTQVVNGIKYFLTLELAETDCRKPLSAVNMNRTLCNQVLTEETDICEMSIVEKPWQKTLEMVSARCYDKSEYPNSPRDEFIVPVLGTNLHTQQNNQFTASPTVSSGVGTSVVSPTQAPTRASTKPSQNTLNFVLSEFNRREVDDNDDEFYKILNVVEFASTREAGGEVEEMILELGETICSRRRKVPNCPLKAGESIEICFVRVLKGTPRVILSMNCEDRDDFYRLTTNPVITPYKPVQEPFFVPQTKTLGAPGGPVEQPTNASNIMNIARFVVDQYNLQSDENELYKLGKIINAYSQVAGVASYTLELELLETECKKYQPVVDVSKCPVDPREDVEVCQAEVTVTPSGGGKMTKTLNRIFCDEREDFYSKLMRQIKNIPVTSDQPQGTRVASTDKMSEFGNKIADEFDFRSDEDNIFVLVKVLNSRTERDGLKHHLRVELAETVCPKYKQRINKTRCIVDIGEEHKICEAEVEERPWDKTVEVMTLSCFERDDSREEEDDSREVLYPRVHPSAHARPRFPQSRFRMRQGSFESEESNEKYYLPLNMNRQLHRLDSDEMEDNDGAEHFRSTSLFRGPNIFDIDDDDDDIDDDNRNNFRYRFNNNRRTVPRLGDRDDIDDDDDDRDDIENNRDDDGDDLGHFRTTRIRTTAFTNDGIRGRQNVRDRSRASQRSREDDDDDDDHIEISSSVNTRSRQRNTRSREDDEDEDQRRRYDVIRSLSRPRSTRSDEDDDDDKDSRNGYDNDSKSLELLRSVYRSRRSASSSSDSQNRRLERRKRALLGAPSTISVDDPKVKEISVFSLAQVDQESEDPRLRRVEEVMEASRQVVAGLLWSLKLRVSYTQCTKNNATSSVDLSTCQVDSNEPQNVCTVKVYERPWENVRTVQKFNCVPLQGRSR